MLQTKFSGRIEEIGSGRLVSNWFVRRSSVKVGGERLRNVMASDNLDDFLENSVESEKEAIVNVGWIMFYRWILSVRNSEDVERQGIFLFTAGMVTHIFVVGLAGLLAGALSAEILPTFLASLIGFGVLGYGLLTAALNLKAWIGA